MASVGDRVSAIYDAIDNEEFDKAIRIGEKADMRQYPLPQALLAYCYAIRKRLKESLDTCHAVMRMKPTDESTLAALSHALRICQKEDELTAYYELLTTTFPDSVEFMQKLFGLYIKQDNGKKMQLLAQKLYKKLGDKKYVFWTVASMLIQADLPPMMLAVAEKMLHKIFYEFSKPANTLSVAETARATVAAKAAVENQPGAEELELYLQVLQKQGKFKQSLDILKELQSRDAGAAIDCGEDFQADGSRVKLHSLRYLNLCSEIICILLGEGPDDALFSEIKDIQNKILKSYPDQWDAHKLLIALEVTSSVDGSGLPCDDSSLLKHREFLRRLQRENSYLRGPYLAEIELLCVWAGRGQDLPPSWVASESPAGFSVPSTQEAKGAYSASVDIELSTLLCKYMYKFQSKQCCFSDVKSYLQKLGVASLSALRSWATTRRNELEEDLSTLADSSAWSDVAEKVDTEAAAEEGPAQAEEKVSKSKKRRQKKQAKNKASASSGAADEVRGTAVKLLCSHSKMGQVSNFASYLEFGSSPTEKFAEEQPRSLDLFEKTRQLCLNSIGGEKEVQPGDEMLLLLSVQHRAANKMHEASTLEGFARFVRWQCVLEGGIQVSPYSYALKLESFGPLRELACASEVLDQFTELKVRHVQNDSMSYLLLPSLMEAGLYKQARRQHSAVLAFHRAAVRDTADMIAESFNHANYTKGLEMKQFLRKCTSSMQLALTKAEFPLVEILVNEKPIEFIEVAKYLEDYVANEAQPLYDDAALKSLSDNNDYSLLVRCDSTSDEEVAAAALRRKQIENRIREGQLSLRMLSSAINADTEDAQGYLDKLLDAVRARLDAPVSVESITLDNKVPGGSADSSYIQFKQELQCGGKDFEWAIWSAVENVVSFSLAAARTLQASLALHPSGDDDRSDREGGYTRTLQTQAEHSANFAEKCIETIACIQNMLLEDIHFPSPESNASNVVLPMQPQWIKKVSCFCRTLAPWALLLLQAARNSLPQDSMKLKGKNSANRSSQISSDDVSNPLVRVSIAVKNVLNVVQKLVDAVKGALEREEEVLMGDSIASSESDAKYENTLKICEPIGENITGAAKLATVRKLMNGQRATLESLRQLLQNLSV